MCLFVCVWTQLNNRLFEELAMDVYDEVDRRENDAGKNQAPIQPPLLSHSFPKLVMERSGGVRRT